MARRRDRATELVAGVVVPAALLDPYDSTWRTEAAAKALLDVIDPTGEHRAPASGDLPGRRYNRAIDTFALAHGATGGGGRWPRNPDWTWLAALGMRRVGSLEIARQLSERQR